MKNEELEDVDDDVPSKRALPGEPVRLRKPHEMIVMVPRSKRVTLTGRRIYNVLLQLAQRRLAAIDKMPAADEIPFEAPLSAILRASGSSVEDRTVAKRYLKEMRSLEVDWESTAPGDGIKYQGFNMLSEVIIEQRSGENWVRWAFPPTIMGALKEPQRWAILDLDIMAKLGTYVAIALYDICARYRDNPSGLTSRKPVQWWTDALSAAPAGTERREWRKFKNERIKEAVEEINRVTDLEVELIEHKQGRVIMEAQFAVRKKAGSARPLFELTIIDANLVHRAEMLGVSEAKLDRLLQEFGDVRVREAVGALEQRVAKRDLRVVESGYAWLRSWLRGPMEPVKPTVIPGPRPAPAVGAPTTPAPAAEAPAATPLSDVDPTQRSRRMAELRAEFLQMEAGEQEFWVQTVLATVKDNPVFGPAAKKRVLSGDRLYGFFGETLIRTWAEKRYGSHWLTMVQGEGQGSLLGDSATVTP
jgi:hypothetical protein